MTTMRVLYEGGLHCKLTHDESGNVIVTDAPKDNNGKGEAFSPTDLLACALASCILTVLGIRARNEGVVLDGAQANVEKVMVNEPIRRISLVKVDITLPATVSLDKMQEWASLEKKYPVQESLHPETKVEISFSRSE